MSNASKMSFSIIIFSIEYIIVLYILLFASCLHYFAVISIATIKLFKLNFYILGISPNGEIVVSRTLPG